MVKKVESKRKVNPKYNFDIFRCDMGGSLFGKHVVHVMARDLKSALKTIPSAESITKLEGQIIITTEVAKDIVGLSKEKWVK
jgi:hypothetical protein